MLGVLLAPKFIVLYVFIASAIYTHYRGRVRLSFLRQLTDHSTFVAPINCFMYAFSAVPNRPVLDLADFPDLKPLQDNWQIIRDEALSLYHKGEAKASDKYDDLGFNSFFRTGWKRFYLKWYDEPLPSARALCPHTVALMNSVASINGAMFALLPPGAQLVAHRDPYAGSLRCHLGLVTPNDDKCRIYIDGHPYSWRDGEAIVFDETYIHKAMNESDKDRIILFCNVTGPLRGRFATAINHYISRRVLRETATSNQAADPVGVFNRMFKYAYQVRIAGKALKRRNRAAYYTLKYMLLGGILALILI
jgi:beta-hydroxylase